MKTKIKMFCGKALRLSLVTVALTLAGSGVANAILISQTFLSGQEGGIVTYDDNLGSNQLRLTFDNISSIGNGAITGIVFNVTTNILAASVLSFKDGNNTAITGWTVGLNVNNETTPGNTVFDVAFETTNGINGGIYNSGVATNFSNVVPDIATLILTITNPSQWSLSSIDSDSILRMQRTGANGEGSLKIVTSTSSSSGTSGQASSGNSIPEPGMLALLSAGLLGQGLLIRQRRRRQK
ncbi:MAG: PEP-CTERM sorting domain-containing protein [Candidatus Nitrotoga sp.]|nr:PEP-CTERM sorting domain-containing protein [Candidatus Nitrotoga sp.]MDP1854818.1 PEP-CTERM sorting domain-containing protein [Candidatus Nitrotoga sp.]